MSSNTARSHAPRPIRHPPGPTAREGEPLHHRQHRLAAARGAGPAAGPDLPPLRDGVAVRTGPADTAPGGLPGGMAPADARRQPLAPRASGPGGGAAPPPRRDPDRGRVPAALP